MIGADGGGIGWRNGQRQRIGSQMPGQMILVSGCGIGLVCRGQTGASVCIPPGPALCVNDLGREPPGLWGFGRRGRLDWRERSFG